MCRMHVYCIYAKCVCVRVCATVRQKQREIEIQSV